MTKIERWEKLSTELKRIKAEEMALRREICAEILSGIPLPARWKGNYDGIDVKAENGVSHNIDNAGLSAVWKELLAEEKNVVKFEPKLKLREYKKLNKEALIHEVIIVKPSAPTLTIL
ncbi:MAG: hypothetical protein R3250_14565 [Melioribacteraceae bacterium]|nr:hypothetical protein [Melioribacteraceae bacterium]